MRLPFSLDQFLGVFRAYHDAIGLTPFLLVGLGVALIGLAHSQVPWRDRAITAGLGALWAWAGVVYHGLFFSSVNPAASFFGVLFVTEGVVLFTAAARDAIRFTPVRHGIGWVVLAYALVFYPLIGNAMGHGYPNGPSFGAPCPVTLFTLGMMLWTRERPPLTVLAIPLLWVAIGTVAALQLGMVEDFGLAVAGVLVVTELMRRSGWRLAGPDPG
jgi:hypothetical protein